MTVTTVAINCDVSLADDTEFTAARLDFTLSGPDFDSASNDTIPAHTVSVTLDVDGLGTANLWPVDLGINNTHYIVTVVGSFVQSGATKSAVFVLGNIRPPSAGAPFPLADLLAQESGGIIVGSTVYATLAAAVAAAVAAASSASASAAEAALYDPTLRYASVPLLLASTRAAAGEGTIWQAGEFLYMEAASGATDYHVITAGGVKLKRAYPQASPKGRARLALIFDDGYKNNVTLALPILKKYGFAATIAVEVERINQNYLGFTDRPVVTADDMREWIRAGGSIVNHPSLDIGKTEAGIAADAVAENLKLRDILTGALVWDGGGFIAGAVRFPEFANFWPDMAAYRGGLRTVDSDKAYRTVFDKIRGIPGPTATRGDGIYITTSEGEFPNFWSGYAIDDDGDDGALALHKAFVSTAGGSESTGVIYAHFTPLTDAEGVAASPTPYITVDRLEEVCAAAKASGVEIVPIDQIGRANVASSGRMESVNDVVLQSGAVGNECAWDTSKKLNSLPMSLRLKAVASSVGSNKPAVRLHPFISAPFSRYRVTVRYLIDVDLVRDASAINNGVEIALVTSFADSARSSDLNLTEYEVTRAAIPYAATATVWVERSIMMYSGLGGLSYIDVSLSRCTGEAWIGHILVEKMDSFSKRPITYTTALDTVIGGKVYLGTPLNGGSRKWEWCVKVLNDIVTTAVGEVVQYAYSDSADVPARSSGDKVYVLGKGVGDFSGKGGQIGTWDGSVWGSWFSPSNNIQIQAATNGEGFGNARYWHIRRGIKGQYKDLNGVRGYVDGTFVRRVNGGQFDVYHESGMLTDSITVTAWPVIKD